jgi:hypothetical protein
VRSLSKRTIPPKSVIPADLEESISTRSKFTPGPADVSAHARFGSVIFCLTRDRPQTLIHALNAVSLDLKKAKLRPRAFIVLDDSVSAQCRLENIHIMKRISEDANCVCLYHGAAEQHRMLVFMATRWRRNANTFDLFFRRLGGLKWDLGGVRSYAMVLANVIGKPSSPIVMIDDDIVILPQARSQSAIDTLERDVLDNPRLLTGGIIKGSPDESSVETAIRRIGHLTHSKNYLLPSEMAMPVSGGFIALNNASSYLYPFPRWYNEDWTWLAQCQTQGYSVRVDRRVVAKQIFSQKELSLAIIKREQEGELLFEALNWSIKNYSRAYVPRALKSRAYWEDVAREEVVYLNRIIEFVRGIETRLSETRLKHHPCIQQILQLLKRTKRHVASIEPKAMMRRYGRYLEAAKPWRSLIETARQYEMDLAVIGRKV